MLGLARRLIRDDDAARDVVQDAFVAAFRAIDGFAAESRLSTWLHRIVVNTALMKLRSRRRRPEEPIDPLLPAFKDDGHHVAEFRAWPDPEQALARRETREAVKRAIGRLPESYRSVLVLRDLQEMNTAETARALGLTENAVKIRLHRARQALRTLLDDWFRKGEA
jgi:RNA polymerase sigma-70 factor (ECF subfamily)